MVSNDWFHLHQYLIFNTKLWVFDVFCVKIILPSGVQEKMGIMNRGMVYGLWDYTGENPDELSFHEGDCMTIVRREDEDEIDWWWARMGDTEGYIPRNLLGVSHESEPLILNY